VNTASRMDGARAGCSRVSNRAALASWHEPGWRHRSTRSPKPCSTAGAGTLGTRPTVLAGCLRPGRRRSARRPAEPRHRRSAACLGPRLMPASSIRPRHRRPATPFATRTGQYP
jgi:hypothetical protein